jgi:hypothetical protein
MTPKEKALLLIRRFYSIGAIECKKSSLIVINEIIEELDYYIFEGFDKDYVNSKITFWQEVKKEIEKL